MNLIVYILKYCQYGVKKEPTHYNINVYQQCTYVCRTAARCTQVHNLICKCHWYCDSHFLEGTDHMFYYNRPRTCRCSMLLRKNKDNELSSLYPSRLHKWLNNIFSTFFLFYFKFIIAKWELNQKQVNIVHLARKIHSVARHLFRKFNN